MRPVKQTDGWTDRQTKKSNFAQSSHVATLAWLIKPLKNGQNYVGK